MIPTTALFWIGIAASLLMIGLWWIQWRTNDAGVVDVGWALGLGVAIVVMGMVADGNAGRRWLVVILGATWAIRLGVYLGVNRVLHATQEDGRYQRMREAMGAYAQAGFFLFFQVQALFILLFLLPLTIPLLNPTPLWTVFDWIGIAIWIIAVGGEALADRQLAHFRSKPNNRGKTCRVGLWRYSRHPNYFFEWVHWLAYPFLSVNAPHFWVVCLAPVVMYVFLMKITGVPFTEQQSLSHRPDYADYQKSTNMFFPWFPKH